MSRKIKYELLEAESCEELSAEVNERLDQGWQPFGSPLRHQGKILQAVVLKENAVEKRLRRSTAD